RSPLQGEQALQCHVVADEHAEAVDGVGRQADDLAGAKRRGGGLLGGDDAGAQKPATSTRSRPAKSSATRTAAAPAASASASAGARCAAPISQTTAPPDSRWSAAPPSTAAIASRPVGPGTRARFGSCSRTTG